MALHKVMRPPLRMQLDRASVQATNEALGVERKPSIATLVTKLSKGVDNDTEENVQKDNDDDNEEGKVKCETRVVLLFARVYLSNSFTYTSSQAKTNVEGADKAVQYVPAFGIVIRFSSGVGSCLFITVNIVFRKVYISKN